MGNLRAGSTPRPAEEWPDWVDDDRWGLGPDPDDAEWWAGQNAEGHDEDGPDPDDPIRDEWAQESAAIARHELGLRMY